MLKGVQPSDGSVENQMDTQSSRSVYVCQSNGAVTDHSTSAVLDPSGRAHNIVRLPNPLNQMLPDVASNQPQSRTGPMFQNTIPPLAGGSHNDTLVISDIMFDDTFMSAIDNSNFCLSFSDEGLNDISHPNVVAQAKTPSTPQLAPGPLFQPDSSRAMEQTLSYYEDSSFDMSADGSLPLVGGPGGSGLVEELASAGITYYQNHDNVFNTVPAVAARRVDDQFGDPYDQLKMDLNIFSELGMTASSTGDVLQPLYLEDDYLFSDQLTNVHPAEESKQQGKDIQENLDLIKLMKKSKLSVSAPGFVPPDHILPPSQLPLSPKHTPSTPSPSYPIQASSPANCMLSESLSFPAPPESSITPAPSSQGPFNVQSFVKGDNRFFELIVREDLNHYNQMMALKALVYCKQMGKGYKECLDNPCDLKSANSTVAELCDPSFSPDDNKLVMKMPADCKPYDRFFRDNKDELDLRIRHHILLQILNLMAIIHTRGSLWGCFLVWVSPTFGVYILPNFPVMLSNMEKSNDLASFDPRSEDCCTILDLYRSILKPFISHLKTWSSPGLAKLLGSRFEDVLISENSVSRMAEAARNLGERRLCKIEVDIELGVELDIIVYCLEHETLERALGPIAQMVRFAAAWKVQYAYHNQTYSPVGKEDIAVADREVKVQLVPHLTPHLSIHETGLMIYTGPCN